MQVKRLFESALESKETGWLFGSLQSISAKSWPLLLRTDISQARDSAYISWE